MPSKSQSAPKRHAWIIDVNMGYGHSRPAHCLTDLSNGEVISANDYPGIPAKDEFMWRQSRQLYETVSRLKPIPGIGDLAFSIMDWLQEIEDFYPRRDLSRPNLQLRQIYAMIKKGLGAHLIQKLSKNPLPIISTFFIPAFIADYHDYPGEIYCVTTDADISRAWAPLNPKNSRIKYFASNGRVVERLKLYGVPADNIYLTGFPLPKELIGGYPETKLLDMLAGRLCNLDPLGIFHERYAQALFDQLGPTRSRLFDVGRPLTITFMVGGAGAQRHLAVDIMKSLRTDIRRKRVRLNLLAGTRPEVAEFFLRQARALDLDAMLGSYLNIPLYKTRGEYFRGFNQTLLTTDIIWTKPSEMSFYTALGFAIIMAPPIGSQEEFNQVWLQYVGGGMPQGDPRYTNEWLFDWINSGGMARMAWSGYVEAPTHGTYRIEDIVLGRKSEIHQLPLIV